MKCAGSRHVQMKISTCMAQKRLRQPTQNGAEICSENRSPHKGLPLLDHCFRHVPRCQRSVANDFSGNDRFQNQGLKTGSIAVTRRTTLIVASMLLIFPCVKLHCVSSARESCLDYVWPVDVHMLFV